MVTIKIHKNTCNHAPGLSSSVSSLPSESPERE